MTGWPLDVVKTGQRLSFGGKDDCLDLLLLPTWLRLHYPRGSRHAHLPKGATFLAELSDHGHGISLGVIAIIAQDPCWLGLACVLALHAGVCRLSNPPLPSRPSSGTGRLE